MRMRLTPWTCVLLLIGAGLVTGCRMIPADPVTDEVANLKRPTWYGHYERGLAHVERERWGLAVQDFGMAAGIVPGVQFPKSAEGSRVRTYGVHFLNDYRPIREYGICQYHLGNLHVAKTMLLRSIKMERTTRAVQFLEMVNNRIESQGPP